MRAVLLHQLLHAETELDWKEHMELFYGGGHENPR